MFTSPNEGTPQPGEFLYSEDTKIYEWRKSLWIRPQSKKTPPLVRSASGGEIYLGARATALQLHDNLSSQGLEQLKKVWRCLGAEFEQVSELASLLLRYAYDDADSDDKNLLLATVLAFYGTHVEATPGDVELAGLPLTVAKFNYWREEQAESVERLVQTAYNPQAPFILLSAGRLVKAFLDHLPSHEARVAGLTSVLLSELAPYLPPPIIEPDEEMVVDKLMVQIYPLIEELAVTCRRVPMTNIQVVRRAFWLAEQAELTPEQTQVMLAGLVGWMSGSLMFEPQLTVLLCHGHTSDVCTDGGAAAKATTSRPARKKKTAQ